mgnify:CR=1 FL=1|jgi:hypothetical protein
MHILRIGAVLVLYFLCNLLPAVVALIGMAGLAFEYIRGLPEFCWFILTGCCLV